MKNSLRPPTRVERTKARAFAGSPRNFADVYPKVDTRMPSAVEVEVTASYRDLFPRGNRYYVNDVFGWAIDYFNGDYSDYQPIDARYHDFEHTLQGTLCLARLLRRRQELGAQPALTQRAFELGIAAILLHDTGYLKKRSDTEGTGAKYTLTHVNRSCEFAEKLLAEKKFADEEIRSVQNMIRCTGLNVNLKDIDFRSELARMVGFGLGTADLLGQMAADDYVDKLPVLYAEFAEAGAYSGRATAIGDFLSVEDLIQKTPGFWENYVWPKVTRDFEGLYRYLNDPYPDGPNYYVQRIEANINRLRAKLGRAGVA
jgi:hypothetical protein